MRRVRDTLRRQPLLAGLGALVLGLASAGAGTGPLPPGPLVATSAGLAAAGWRLRTPALGAWCGALLIAGAAVGAARTAELDEQRDTVADGLAVHGRALLLERPRTSRYGTSAEIRLTDGPGAGVTLVARADAELRWPDGARPGHELSVSGFARGPRTEHGDGFDWAAQLTRTGVAGELELERVTATGATRGGMGGMIDAARVRAEIALAAGASPGDEALIRGMVLGQDERIDALVRDDFRDSGLAHLLAVSGQNVLLLSLVAMPVLAGLGLGRRGRLVALLGLIAVYVPLAGAGPSLQRAGVMGAAAIVALLAGRPASRWYALLLAAAVTLALNPRACGEPGWQLSFAAVAGILVLAPSVRRALPGLPDPLAQGAALTVAATVATGPLMMHHFDQASLASLPANLLALPAVAPAMWIGMAQVVLGQVLAVGGAPAGLALAVAEVCGAVNGALLGYIAWLARRFAELPWATAEIGLGSPLAVAGAYGAIAALTLVWRRLARRAGPPAAALAGHWRTAAPHRKAGLALVLGGAVAVLAVEASDPDAPPDRLTVSFLDVGQGDATLVQHPDGGSILIDGGPADGRVLRLVRNAGVERLDLVVATHAASDHHGGLAELVGQMPVGLLLEGGDGTDDPGFRDLLAEARSRGVRTLAARAGQRLRVGELAVEVLWPAPRDGPPPDDPNLRAVTTVVRAGDFELLASGDAESPSLAALELPDVDLLKVPHHGSEDEGLPELLTRLRPEVAAIGVGEGNGYGHPTPSTLRALERAEAEVYRTDLDGTIAVSVGEGGLAVETER